MATSRRRRRRSRGAVRDLQASPAKYNSWTELAAKAATSPVLLAVGYRMARPDAHNHSRAGAVGRRAHARSHGGLVGGPSPSRSQRRRCSPLVLLLCGRLVAADVQAQEAAMLARRLPGDVGPPR